MLKGERAVQAYLYHPIFFTALVQGKRSFNGGFGSGAHQDNYLFGIGSAKVLEQFIMPAGMSFKFIHYSGYHIRCFLVKQVHGFASLEVYIGVLCRTADKRIIGVHGTASVVKYKLIGYHGPHYLVIYQIHFVYFVRSAETIKKVQERYARTHGGCLRNQREVMRFLYRCTRQQGKARCTRGHYILVIAKNRKALCSKRACCYVKHSRGKLSRNFVHIGQHEH